MRAPARVEQGEIQAGTGSTKESSSTTRARFRMGLLRDVNGGIKGIFELALQVKTLELVDRMCIMSGRSGPVGPHT